MKKKAIFINTVSQVLVRFITLAFTLISIKLLTNYLGPSGVGNYNTITTYINFFIVIADLGLFAVGVREISKNPEQEKKILSNIFVIRLISALIATGIAVTIVFLTKYDQSIKLGVLIATGFLFFNLLSSVYDITLQYRLKMQYSAFAEFLSKLISLIALYVIIKLSGSFLAIVSTIALSGFLVFLFKWLFSVKFVNFWPKYDRKACTWLFNLGWPLGLVFIVNNLFFKLDTLLLFVIKGSAAVGIYSVSYKVLEVTTFIAGYFASALKPTISQEIRNNKAALASIINKSITVMLLLALPITIICLAFPKEIVVFLSNQDFISGGNALIILGAALPFIYLDVLFGEILIAQDSRKLLFWIAVFMLLFNLSANLLIIPRFSFIGAAFTTLLSEIVLLAINIHYTRKIVPYSIKISQIFKILLVLVLSLGFAYLIKIFDFNFFILIAIVILFYLGSVQVFNLASYSSIKSLLRSAE